MMYILFFYILVSLPLIMQSMEVEQPKPKKTVSEKLHKILFPYKYPKTDVSIQFFEQEATPGTKPYAKIKIPIQEAKKFPFFQAAMQFPSYKGKIIISQDFMQSDAVAFNVKLANVIKSLSKEELDSMRNDFDQGFYTIPAAIDATFPPEINVRLFHEAAVNANQLGSPNLTPLILANYAKRIMANPIPAKSPKEPLQFGYEHDKTIAKVIINTALIKKAQDNLKDMFYSLPLDYLAKNISTYTDHYLDIKINEELYLAPTCTAQHCLAIYTGGTGQKRFGKCIFEKKENSNYFPDLKVTPNTILTTDVSFNMNYLVALVMNRQNESSLIVGTIDNIEEEPPQMKSSLKIDKTLMPKEDQTVRVMFQKNSHIFYVKLGDIMYECDADSDELQLNKQIAVDDIPSSIIKNVFKKDEPDMIWILCEGTKQDPKNFFDTSVLHRYFHRPSMQQDILVEAESIYAGTGQKISMEIDQGICNKEDYCHYYLLKHTGLKENRKRYNLISAQFKPDQRLEPYLQLLNTQQKNLEQESEQEKKPGEKLIGSSLLYPNALCIYHLYTNDFDITESTIQRKMGPLYDFVSDELKVLLPKPSIYRQAWHYLRLKHAYRNYIKHNLGYVTWAAMAGTLGYFVLRLSPQNRLEIGLPLGLAFVYGSLNPAR